MESMEQGSRNVHGTSMEYGTGIRELGPFLEQGTRDVSKTMKFGRLLNMESKISLEYGTPNIPTSLEHGTLSTSDTGNSKQRSGVTQNKGLGAFLKQGTGSISELETWNIFASR